MLCQSRTGLFRIWFVLLFGSCLAACDNPAEPTANLTVTGVAPSTVSATGGTIVTVSGSGFLDGTTVAVGTTVAPPLTRTPTTISFEMPAQPAGAGTVSVRIGGKTASAAITVVAPSGTNKPPVVSAIRTTTSRPNQPSLFVDLNELVTVNATVTDADTGATYEWSVNAGTVSEGGPSAVWRVPASAASVPFSASLTLRVTEVYTEAGIQHRNLTSATATASIHNSDQEIFEKGYRFLDRFSQSSYTVDDVLVDFSPTCDGGRGRSDEAGDVLKNRTTYLQLPGYSVATVPPVTYNFGGSCTWTAFAPDVRVKRGDACSTYDVRWIVRYLKDTDDEALGRLPAGTIEETTGRDFVTSVVENNVWRLCHSDFKGTRKVTKPNGIQMLGVVER